MTQLSEHFRRSEFSCKCGCGYDTVDSELVDLLECIREDVSAPLYINSASRCEKHNARVGGGKRSQHLVGRAADIWSPGVSPVDIKEAAKKAGAKGIGLYEDFVHVDTRSGKKANWEG
jgi:uncharacterized protein YcbK (DUF882 family)